MKVNGKSGLAAIAWACFVLLGLAGCRNDTTGAGSGRAGRTAPRIIGGNGYVEVNSLLDVAEPPPGVVTLRSAVEQVASGGTIGFAEGLDNGTIDLSIVGEPHSILVGEVFTMVPGAGWSFEGFQERDYGASALYAAKDIDIDASSLPSGITLRWTGGDGNRARVLAVYGNLSMTNVTIRGGYSSAAAISPIPATDNHANQPWTLARGGAVACWGSASFVNCTFGENRVLGDSGGSRDRGAFGGAIYGDAIDMDNCIVSGNRAEGYGAAGGGIYSVTARDQYYLGESNLRNCSITGNRVTGEHAYGGGVYTDGGSIGNMNTLKLSNCTIARNLVEDNPAIPEVARNQYYCRGGGVYMSNGYLSMTCCTVAENEVTGVPAIFSGKANMGGGGVAATVGNAHDVEDMTIQQSVIVGNKLNGVAEDLFTGSLIAFFSNGYNRIGRIDFNPMLVPIPAWSCLSRKHWPKAGDADGIALADALRVSDARRHPSIRSAGTDDGQPALLWYPPADALVDQAPSYPYTVDYLVADYWQSGDNCAPLLDAVMGKLREQFGSGFGASLGNYPALSFNVIASEWPSDNGNLPWITFWHALDNEIGTRMGVEKLGDDFWGSILPSSVSDGQFSTYSSVLNVTPNVADQRGVARPAGIRGDIGAVERTVAETPAPAPAAVPAGHASGCSAVPGEAGSSGAAGGLLPLLALAIWRGVVRRR